MPPHESLLIHEDCRAYRGDRPCTHNRLCADCSHYAPIGRRVCVIKLGALGDVIRTLCILPHLRREDPNTQITWVTSPAAAEFIQAHPQIDQVMTFDAHTIAALPQQSFDLLISLDKEPGPTGLAMSIHAGQKKGIGMGPSGRPVPLNHEAARYFALGLSDDLKFRRNQSTYPQLVYEALGWAYAGQTYSLPLTGRERKEAADVLTQRGWSPHRPTVGINVGAATTFANKVWPTDRLADLAGRLRTAEPDTQVLLLGGPQEQARVEKIAARVPGCIDAGCEHPARRFVGVIDRCDVVFCGDTLAMHLAIARQRGVVAFFGPTCEQEIDLFDLGEKLVAATPCAPCYKRHCDMADVCLHAVEVGEALASIRRVLAQRRAEGDAPPLKKQAG